MLKNFIQPEWFIYTVMTFLLAIGCFLYLDLTISSYFYSLKNSLMVLFFKQVTHLGESHYYLVLSILIYLGFRKRSSALASKALFVFWSVALSGIISDIIKVVVARYRPELYFEKHLYGFKWFDIGYGVNSFPSGHSATALAAFIALGLLFPRYKIFFLFIGMFIAFSRIAIVAHYPSDVLVGGYIGVVTALLLYRFMKFLQRETHVSRSQQLV